MKTKITILLLFVCLTAFSQQNKVHTIGRQDTVYYDPAHSNFVRKANVTYLPLFSDIVPYFALPDTGITIMVGQDVTIYGDALINVPIGTNLVVNYVCDIGTEIDNNIHFNASIADTGIHRFIINAYEGSSIIIKDTIWLTVYEKAPIGTKKILLIGDSTTGAEAGVASSVTSNLSDLTLTFIGTIGTTYKNEGYGGASYNGFITGVHGKFYKAPRLNFPAYFSDYSIDIPDYVYIRLGINDTYSFCVDGFGPITDAAITTIINRAKLMCDSILKLNDTIKIILGVPTICENTGAGWAANYDELTAHQDLYISQIHWYWQRLISTFANGVYNSRIDCSYEAINLDRDEGYPKTEGVHTNGLHPDVSGYAQIGNGLSAYINREISKDLVPTLLTSTWVNDYDSLHWVDNTGGVAAYEVWESRDNGLYVLVATTSVGATNYNNYTWQNSLMKFKIRAKYNTWYSDWSNVVSTNTPLVFKTDQSTLTQVKFATFHIDADKTVNINWGDGTNADYTSTNLNITHDYSITKNPYYITISGEVNYINNWVPAANVALYGDLSKWSLPNALTRLTFAACSFSGNLNNWVIPPNMTILDIGGNLFTFTGTGWTIPTLLTNINIGSTNTFAGSWSGSTFAVGTTRFYASSQNLTSSPRGNYKDFDSAIGLYLKNNNMNQSEIDALLLDIDNYFNTHTPDNNSLFYLAGTGMSAPSATGLAARTSIINKYTAAGFTATITINP